MEYVLTFPLSLETFHCIHYAQLLSFQETINLALFNFGFFPKIMPITLGKIGDLEPDFLLYEEFLGETAGPDTLRMRVKVKSIWAEPLKGSQMSQMKIPVYQSLQLKQGSMQ